MKVLNDSGNLLFDDENPLCSLISTLSQGKRYAFLICLDIGVDGLRVPKKSDQRRYWGEYSHDDPKGTIREIMHTGGKWSKFEP